MERIAAVVVVVVVVVRFAQPLPRLIWSFAIFCMPKKLPSRVFGPSARLALIRRSSGRVRERRVVFAVAVASRNCPPAPSPLVRSPPPRSSRMQIEPAAELCCTRWARSHQKRRSSRPRNEDPQTYATRWAVIMVAAEKVRYDTSMYCKASE